MALLRHKGLLDGADKWATVMDEASPHIIDGIEMKPYLIVPNKRMIEAYPHIFMKKGALNVPTERGNGIWQEFPTYWVIDENPSRTDGIARVLCTIDNQPTCHTKRHEMLTNEIKRLQQELEAEILANISLMEDYKDAMREFSQKAKIMGEINQLWTGHKKEVSEDDETKK